MHIKRSAKNPNSGVGSGILNVRIGKILAKAGRHKLIVIAKINDRYSAQMLVEKSPLPF
ncbi:hypothetical protein Desti_4184 [Desulfomonile tiedjei DSM 6799]|uniref:Uncharacterized protein n=1 Tax=Desulfomonile tiedjei (strain ATCC 49306 / DSM 6799 / DCB-1) TaxID=706587 RepID=I4CB80_DESTA|nr:hypothetical protein Desti_4184 [Desulfomonile tiedjei DSM 6799]